MILRDGERLTASLTVSPEVSVKRRSATLWWGFLCTLCAFALLQWGSGALEAQTPDPRCGTVAGGSSALPGGDACQTIVDLFRYVAPQVGTLVAGGNATLGQGGTLGGLGHFALTLRANVTQSFSLPDLEAVSVGSGPAIARSYTTTKYPAAFPVADLALGVLRGLDVGRHRVGGLDLIANVFYVPTEALEGIDANSFAVTVDGKQLQLGFGARVELLAETKRLPSLAVSYVQRDIPRISLTHSIESDNGRAQDLDTLSFRGLSVRTKAWRAVVGKRLSFLGLVFGIGKDSYSENAALGYSMATGAGRGRIRGSFPLADKSSALNMFGDLAINLRLFRTYLEVGRVSGSEPKTFSAFSTPGSEPRLYGAVGIRIGR